VKSTILAALLAVAPAFAQQAAPTKIGVVHLEQVLVSTAEGQKTFSGLNAKWEPKKKELDEMQSSIAAKQAELQKGANTIAAARAQQLDTEIKTLTTRYNRDSQDAQEAYEQEFNKLRNDLGQKLMALVTKYGSDNSFSLIVDVSSQQTPVLYVGPGIEITQQIIELYDKTHPVAGAAPAAPAAKPPAAPKPTGAAKP
jgi:outer membrane protein